LKRPDNISGEKLMSKLEDKIKNTKNKISDEEIKIIKLKKD